MVPVEDLRRDSGNRGKEGLGGGIRNGLVYRPYGHVGLREGLLVGVSRPTSVSETGKGGGEDSPTVEGRPWKRLLPPPRTVVVPTPVAERRSLDLGQWEDISLVPPRQVTPEQKSVKKHPKTKYKVSLKFIESI